MIQKEKRRFILKIYDNLSTREINVLSRRLQLLSVLKRRGIPVQKSMLTTTGKNFYVRKPLCFTLFEYIKGKSVRDSQQHVFFREAVTLHTNLLTMMQHCQIKKNFFLDDFTQKVRNIFKNKEFVDYKLMKSLKSNYNEFINLNFSKLRKGIIHGDFRRGNLIEYDGKIVGIIDFDNACYDYLILEVARSSVSFACRKIAEMRRYVLEFDKRFPLTKYEKEAYVPFVQMALLYDAVQFKKKIMNNIGNKSDNVRVLRSIEYISDAIRKKSSVLNDL